MDETVPQPSSIAPKESIEKLLMTNLSDFTELQYIDSDCTDLDEISGNLRFYSGADIAKQTHCGLTDDWIEFNDIFDHNEHVTVPASDANGDTNGSDDSNLHQVNSATYISDSYTKHVLPQHHELCGELSPNAHVESSIDELLIPREWRNARINSITSVSTLASQSSPSTFSTSSQQKSPSDSGLMRQSHSSSDASGLERNSSHSSPYDTVFTFWDSGVFQTGPKFKLLREGDIHVCYLNHTRTVISKILSSKFLRRWENHHLYLNDACISSKTHSGCLENSIPYSQMEQVYTVSRWDASQKFCLRIVVLDGSYLLQAGNSYMRDQWYHSIIWKKNIFRYRNVISMSTRQDVLLKELKNMVEFSKTTPLQDECIYSVPVQIISKLLMQDEGSWKIREFSEELIAAIAPLIENYAPSKEMCLFFSRHCQNHPRSPIIADYLTPIVNWILKHNVDFSKSPYLRVFVQDYIFALYSHNAGEEILSNFVHSVHGAGSDCPHHRVLPNLVSICFGAVFTHYEAIRTITPPTETECSQLTNRYLRCYLAVFLLISEYDDWRLSFAQLLQPIPFPNEMLQHEAFVNEFAKVIERIGTDTRCDVHQMVLGIRESKPGWFHLYCPSNMICSNADSLWCTILHTLLSCCCRRKRFLTQLSQHLGACLLLALRHQVAAQEALCLMLEWDLIEDRDQKLQAITTLQSTACGRAAYRNLCKRQQCLKDLQQKGGPRKLTLPNRSTDADLALLFSSGSFGNLECLSLAFTRVTSACAEHLIKLTSLRYLNLWATQFGDVGVQMISEHLTKLQVLNLCETLVTDKGIAALSALINLRKLNLNSTKLSAQTFNNLKQQLPELQEFDVRYTDAW